MVNADNMVRVMFSVTTDHLFQSINAHVSAIFTFESELLVRSNYIFL